MYYGNSYRETSCSFVTHNVAGSNRNTGNHLENKKGIQKSCWREAMIIMYYLAQRSYRELQKKLYKARVRPLKSGFIGKLS